MSAPAPPIVEARGVSRVFPMPAGPVVALREVTMEVGEGEYLAIAGPSGCGKSTLLHVLGCVDTATSGQLRLEGRDVGSLSDGERSRIRLTKIGFVFQRFFLLPMLSALENVELPQAEAGVPRVARRDRARMLLECVGLEHRADHRPSELSGGEMQRVAIARALANQAGGYLSARHRTRQSFERCSRNGWCSVLWGGRFVRLLRGCVQAAMMVDSRKPATGLDCPLQRGIDSSRTDCVGCAYRSCVQIRGAGKRTGGVLDNIAGGVP